MIRVAIVEDEAEIREQLMGYVQRYTRQYGTAFEVKTFADGLEILEDYRPAYDLILLDIEMPGSDGLEVAREIRTKDEAVGIIFVTGMAKYAVEGYAVHAIDFIVKPVGYYNFAVKLEKAIQFFRKRQTKEILINGKDGIHRIAAAYVYYIEKSRDDLLFHTVQGDFQMRGSIFRCVRRRYWYSCFCPGDGADC